MTDLVIFAGIVGLVAVLGIRVGMIVAGRIDRISERSPAPPEPGATSAAPAPGDGTGPDTGDEAAAAIPAQEDHP